MCLVLFNCSREDQYKIASIKFNKTKGHNSSSSYNKKEITQIAPSLALKLKTTLPNGTEAIILEEILE